MSDAKALIVVDMQEDFITGSLAVPDAEEIIQPIIDLMGSYTFVVATADWHIPEHESFVAQNGPWPPHCVQDTPGAEIVPAIEAKADAVFRKGQEEESYSGFGGVTPSGITLEQWLKFHSIKKVEIVGLALDFCVFRTAVDAAEKGLQTTVLGHLTRAVQEGWGAEAVDVMEAAGVKVTT